MSSFKSILKDFEGVSFPDPSQYNLPEDFIYVEKEWGSLFYKHIGKNKRNGAKRLCSSEGDSVSLPIPRSAQENEFYRVYFGRESLWLDLVDDFAGVRNEENNYFFIASRNMNHYTATSTDQPPKRKLYDWIDMDLLFTPDNLNGVTMTYTGQWKSVNVNELKDTICVYNIIPESCSKCSDEFFCQYQDGRTKTNCIQSSYDSFISDVYKLFNT